jgi:hypothetical protein
MTESEWLDATDPSAMLDFLHATGRASERKLRLFAVACCRRRWNLLDEQSRDGIRVVEQEPDGPSWATAWVRDQLIGHRASQALVIELPQWGRAGPALHYGQPEPIKRLLHWIARLVHTAANNTEAAARAIPGDELPAARAAWAKAEAATRTETTFQCNLLRDIVRNPFRAVTITPFWQTHEAAKQAETIYHEQAFDRLPAVAEALQVMGCGDAELIEHLRGPGPHARGCWAVDLLTGRK